MLATSKMVSFWQDPITGTPFSNQSCEINTCPWFDELIDRIAKLDGILPPTGTELKNVLETYHGRFHDFNPVHFQIIRW